MVIKFEKEYLSELYNIGKYISKTCPYNSVTVEKYKVRVDTLAAAKSVEQLKVLKSFDLRTMDEEGCFSVCLDYSYRLIFKINMSTCILIDIIVHD